MLYLGADAYTDIRELKITDRKLADIQNRELGSKTGVIVHLVLLTNRRQMHIGGM